MISPGLNLVMTVIGFAVSTMFIIFVCTRLICARIQLRASRRSFPPASRSDLSIMERGIHGLEPVLLSSFPTKKFGDQFTYGEDMQCAVCLSEYQEKDVLRVLPYCGHAFHVNCVDIWLKQHTTCPVCRISLRDYPNGKRTLQNSQTASTRPLDAQGNYDSDSFLYQQVGQDFSTRTTENHRMHQLNSEPSGIDESISALPPVNCSVKVTADHELEGKYKESPSHSE